MTTERETKEGCTDNAIKFVQKHLPEDICDMPREQVGYLVGYAYEAGYHKAEQHPSREVVKSIYRLSREYHGAEPDFKYSLDEIMKELDKI